MSSVLKKLPKNIKVEFQTVHGPIVLGYEPCRRMNLLASYIESNEIDTSEMISIPFQYSKYVLQIIQKFFETWPDENVLYKEIPATGADDYSPEFKKFVDTLDFQDSKILAQACDFLGIYCLGSLARKIIAKHVIAINEPEKFDQHMHFEEHLEKDITDFLKIDFTK
jgi:hypothetical protein